MNTILKIIALDLIFVSGWHVLARLLNWVSEVLILDHFVLVTLLGTPLIIPLSVTFLNFIELEKEQRSAKVRTTKVAMIFICVILSYVADRLYKGSLEFQGLATTDLSLYVGIIVSTLLAFIITKSAFASKLN